MMRLPFVARARAFRPRSSLASSVVVRTKLLHFATLMFSPFFVAGVTTLACGITNRLSARTSRDRSNQSVVADAEPVRIVGEIQTRRELSRARRRSSRERFREFSRPRVRGSNVS